MKEYLIYLAQAYPEFRRAELESLADFFGIPLDMSHHNVERPFIIVTLENDEQAKQIMKRSILSRGIYELWGQGKTYEEVHANVKETSSDRFGIYKESSFKFDFIAYKGSRSNNERMEIIQDFSYLAFEGGVRMKNPDQIFSVLEEYNVNGMEKASEPLHIYFGRQIQLSARTENVLDKYDLRKRKYIGTTSFDAELSLVTCNIGQVGPGKVTYDPFTGTGSFLVAAANFGGLPIGSDIDARALRGKGEKRNIQANFKQYGTSLNFLDVLTMDFTNNAFRQDFGIDTIVCDPPYGVREGLKVCGAKHPEKAEGRENVVIDGEKAHLRRDFIQPKKPYELSDLLDDLLFFAAERLPVGGRLAFWMPTANDDFEVNQIPQHEQLELLYNLEQVFNKWSRRLLVYVKRDETYKGETTNGLKSQNIKNFRVRYFGRFTEESR
ncbi:putative ribonuclease methylating protein [Scheffersomyces xylosifermentans]|uniref:putative ribonuclease methylating protein n=1 Tax=Scheffersomyces xylosifermentans TaxID=1304137 RepID=UPI00315CA039